MLSFNYKNQTDAALEVAEDKVEEVAKAYAGNWGSFRQDLLLVSFECL